MKKILFYLIFAVFSLSSCNLEVLENPKAVTPDKAQDEATDVLLSTAGALKNAMDAHQKLAWTAGLVGNEEIQTVKDAGFSQYARNIESQKTLKGDNSQNRTNCNRVYLALALADNARKGLSKVTFGGNEPKTQALFNANISMVEGMMYGEMSKFYAAVPELGTDKRQTNTEGRDRAIKSLQDAIAQFKIYAANADTLVFKAPGLYNNADIAVKFCNSFIGMLYFDTGDKAKAAAFLELGYGWADAGKELTFKIQNSLTGDGIYPEWRSGIEFELNGYSQQFIDARILDDTSRRLPVKWFTPAPAIAVATNRLVMSYFYPQAAASANPATGTTTAAGYPVISAAEVALMLADPAVGKANAATTISLVLQSWKIAKARADVLSTDPTITLTRVSQFEYAGRGRRWSAVGTYAKWDLANEFNFK
jgi:hypothetical protein